jgi:hypothetical protein
MDEIMRKVRALRKAIEKLSDQVDCIGEAVAEELLLQAIFSEEPPKQRSRRRTTAAQVTK